MDCLPSVACWNLTQSKSKGKGKWAMKGFVLNHIRAAVKSLENSTFFVAQSGEVMVKGNRLNSPYVSRMEVEYFHPKIWMAGVPTTYGLYTLVTNGKYILAILPDIPENLESFWIEEKRYKDWLKYFIENAGVEEDFYSNADEFEYFGEYVPYALVEPVIRRASEFIPGCLAERPQLVYVMTLVPIPVGWVMTWTGNTIPVFTRELYEKMKEQEKVMLEETVEA